MRMKFGIFLAPFHLLGENPPLAIERDFKLIELLDELYYDEAWIGEHHSAGWETIASPEVFIAAAAQRTRHIKLGTGVVSLPYHHPLMVANRIVLLDHLTRGRVMLGVGPGALVTDALMLGIDPTRQRPMMNESLDVIVRLLTDPTPLTYAGEWFTLRDAVLQLRPYSDPHPPIAVASMESPSGMLAAGRHGAGVISLATAHSAVPGRGAVDLRRQWAIAEQAAAEAGKAMRRDEWLLSLPVHLAETREEAFDQCRAGAARFVMEYQQAILGRPAPEGVAPEDLVEHMVRPGAWIVGTPDDCIEAIHRFDAVTGGFGGILARVHDWATREQIMKSFELLARYVMPRFQGSLVGLEASAAWARAHAERLAEERANALDQAYVAHERAATGVSRQ